MGNLNPLGLRRLRSAEDESRLTVAHPTPIADELEQKVTNALKEFAEPYRLCIDTFRESEQKLSSQREELKNSRSALNRERRNLETEKKTQREQQGHFEEAIGALQSENHRLKQELQELKTRTSASYESWKRHKDIRSGDITHEHLSVQFQDYYDTKYRSLLKKLNYENKEERCAFLSSVLQVACKHCNDHVIQQLSRELHMLHQPPSSPRVLDFDLPNLDQIQEKWRDRSAAFGLLLTVAGIDPKHRPELIKDKVLQELLDANESFKAAHDSNPQVTNQILESALNNAWIMGTLVPPAISHEPTKYHVEWHEQVATSGTGVDPKTDEYQLTYCRPVMFFGAEGTVGKVGAVKCLPRVAQPPLRSENVKTSQAQPPIPDVIQPDPHNSELPPHAEVNSEDSNHLVPSSSIPEFNIHPATIEMQCLQSKHDPPPDQVEAPSQDLNSLESKPSPSLPASNNVQEASQVEEAPEDAVPLTYANNSISLSRSEEVAKNLPHTEISEKEESAQSPHEEKTSVSAEEELFDQPPPISQSKKTNELPKMSKQQPQVNEMEGVADSLQSPETITPHAAIQVPTTSGSSNPDPNDEGQYIGNSQHLDKLAMNTQPADETHSSPRESEEQIKEETANGDVGTPSSTPSLITVPQETQG